MGIVLYNKIIISNNTHMVNQWFKFYGAEYLADPKVASLSAEERSCWVTLLCLASVSSETGLVKYMTADVLLMKSGIIQDPYHPEEWERNIRVLEKFQMMRMITLHDNGDVLLNNWNERQQTALSGYERVKRHRMKQRQQQGREVDNVQNSEEVEDILNDNDMITERNENDNGRKEKNRIDKNIYTYDQIFLKFWSMYPKKVGKGKAHEAWNKIKPKPTEETLKQMIEVVEKSKKTDQWKKDNGQFIPFPATFLNQRRWEDEVESTITSPTASKYSTVAVHKA